MFSSVRKVFSPLCFHLSFLLHLPLPSTFASVLLRRPSPWPRSRFICPCPYYTFPVATKEAATSAFLVARPLSLSPCPTIFCASRASMDIPHLGQQVGQRTTRLGCSPASRPTGRTHKSRYALRKLANSALCNRPREHQSTIHACATDTTHAVAARHAHTIPHLHKHGCNLKISEAFTVAVVRMLVHIPGFSLAYFHCFSLSSQCPRSHSAGLEQYSMLPVDTFRLRMLCRS